MEIAGFQKLTLIDYPGHLATVVFLFGCNFRCPFCYNSQLVLPSKIKKEKRILESQFLNFLKEKKGLLEGVVVSGGEPTIHPELFHFIKKIKKMGYLVKLDTNGSRPQILERLIAEKMVDYLAMDIKSPLKKEKYQEATGKTTDLKKIRKSIFLIKNSNLDYEFRTTVIPSLHSKEDILEIVRLIAPAKKYFLQSFLPQNTLNPEFEKINPYPQNFLLEIQKAVSPFFETCFLR